MRRPALPDDPLSRRAAILSNVPSFPGALILLDEQVGVRGELVLARALGGAADMTVRRCG
jgi:hypothetical protein